MKEEWKPIPMANGNYSINKCGFIKNNRTQKRLKPFTNHKGYLGVFLWSNGSKKFISVHRAVMLTFVGDSKLEVNHKDGNKQNNNLSNLEYVTTKENIQHFWRTGNIPDRKGSKSKTAILNEEDVLQIRELLKKGISQRQLGKKFGVHYSTIRKIATRQTWSHI